MSAKIPDQLYVTLRYDDYTKQSVLGFAHPYEPSKQAFLKKQQTQLIWAYIPYNQHMVQVLFDEQTSRYYTTGFKWGARDDSGVPGTYLKIPFTEYIEDILQPRILDNIPLSGFKIAKSVSRRTTSNKLWRVLDPRGFELEISTGNFEQLLMEATVIKGDIMGNCVWVGNKNLKFVGE